MIHNTLLMRKVGFWWYCLLMTKMTKKNICNLLLEEIGWQVCPTENVLLNKIYCYNTESLRSSLTMIDFLRRSGNT